MARKAKKKTPHWTRLPRPKLIARAKRLELQLAKLKAQLAEMRETKLLNERAAVQGQADRLIDNLTPAIEFGYRAGEKGVWNLEMTLYKWSNNGLREMDFAPHPEHSGAAMDERLEQIAACTASHAPNATTSAALEELTRSESMFPWERAEDD